ncbi:MULTISPECIES: hypothetical protein [Calothrix]|uniref:AAA domain-containing protein n=2 Tax=Calothrix TaxID=1186 RepID=A0ABR8A5M9_9CYAN|nr:MULTISPECIES: hypothetical protein [Calothrix]MBD2195241.1 hypothetical protein [Calothrix parietina FACHB-288]MBD2223788.1 hypothetical protein [Calothrix anomala FACHB-343]
MNFFKFFNIFNSAPINLPGGDIRMIGARDVGKTSYLAALSICWEAQNYLEGRIMSVDPYGYGAQYVQNNAENVLKNGLVISASEYADSCKFSIKLKPRFFLNPIATIQNKPLRLNISITAPTGELIENLIAGNVSEDAINDCASVVGLMLVLDSTTPKRDKDYAQAITNLQKELNNIIGTQKNRRRLSRHRIAIVFTKGEQNDVYRYKPQEFAELKFARTFAILQNWQQSWGCSLNFFMCSAFGFIGDTLQPNCRPIQGSKAYTLSKPDAWQAFGLVAPIYWLQTGKDDRQLR